MPSGEAGLTQEYWIYFRENRQSMAAKGPPLGRVDIFQTDPNPVELFLILLLLFLRKSDILFVRKVRNPCF